MRLIIPMSGRGKRFLDAGYAGPKPLIAVQGRPIIAHLLEQFPLDWPKVFICNHEHLTQTALRGVLEDLAPGCTIVGIDPHDKGPVHAVLEGARIAPEILPPDEPCLINYCDFGFSWDPHRFADFARRTACDGAIVCYTGFHPEYIRPSLYAYCRTAHGRVVEVREKAHFTPDRSGEMASSGTYYFRSGALVASSFGAVMARVARSGGEGYVSVAYNQLIARGMDVRIFEIPWFLQWGTPADLEDFEYWSKLAWPAPPLLEPDVPNLQVLMPMAGQGSRFGEGLPKFMRPVNGMPMFKAALAHLPRAQRTVLVVRAEHGAALQQLAPEVDVLTLAEATAGQASTCALAVPELSPGVPVLVSACDHGLLWQGPRWQALLDQGPDLIVWGQRGYPGADVTPEAFAYIAATGDHITAVSVKEPLSATPRRDLLLVGTFWFRDPALLGELVAELHAKDLRARGEFYLDSVVNLAVARGLDVRLFETDTYLCWGTPEALQVYDYWHRFYSGAAAP